MQTYHIWTIGCQMNKADSERLEGALEQLGLRHTPIMAEADVIVLNSCVVRQSAEDKVTGTLGLLKPIKRRRPDSVIALMGCMVGPRSGDLKARYPFVDAFMRPQEYEPLLELVGKRLGRDPEGCLGALLPPRPSVTAYVPVIHGCDMMCSFCIIPYRRGRQASRPVAEVTREVELLAARGVKEVTLLGQTVDAYGLDLPERPDLADLFAALHHIDGLKRVRFLTSHPAVMTDRILHAIAELPKVCETINLPFQAGDDAVLERMRRRYTADDYRRLVDRIRAIVPSATVTTDVIVGFPGETEAQFEATLRLIEDVRFSVVHVAAYSTRPGTIAYRTLEDDVPAAEKARRLHAVEALQERIALEENRKLIGRTLEVLVEGRNKGKWQGRARSDRLVFTNIGENDLLGQTIQVRIERGSAWALQGEVLDPSEDRRRVEVSINGGQAS